MSSTSKSKFYLALPWVPAALVSKKCPNQIADELSMNESNFPSFHASSSSPALYENTMNNINMDYNKKVKAQLDDSSPEQKALQLELYKGLGERKKDLEKTLQEKIKELKELCLQESNYTGELPHEYKLFMTPQERLPTVKKRVGTGFSIAGLVKGKGSDALTKLEMEYELQKQIAKASFQLSINEDLPKNVRKKHKENYKKDHVKLKELEKSIKTAKAQSGIETGSLTSEDSMPTDSSSSLHKSPKKSMSSHQLESLDQSPSATRRRINSTSKLNKSGSRVSDYPSNPSSTSSLASLSHLDICNDFTPTKALKYNRSSTAQSLNLKLGNQSVAELDSAGSSTANSSTSSLHAYSVSNGRPIRSGSMDDVRLASSVNPAEVSKGKPVYNQSIEKPPRNNNSIQRSKNYLANNPYGSLERKALKQRHPTNRNEERPPANNPYTPRLDNSYISNIPRTYTNHNKHSTGMVLSPSQPDLQSQTVVNHQQPHYMHSHTMQHPVHKLRQPPGGAEYPAHVYKSYRQMCDQSQPFQMLSNPYHTNKRSLEQSGHVHSNNHLAPIFIEPRQNKPVPLVGVKGTNEPYFTDSSSNQSSPKENAFVFFDTLSALVQADSNPYVNMPNIRVDPDPTPHKGPYAAEESKPYEMKDYYKYSERLRKARGLANQHSSNNNLAAPQPASRKYANQLSVMSQSSQEGSRSSSPYTFSGHHNSGTNRINPMSNSTHSLQYNTMQTSMSSNNLNSRPVPARRSMTPSKDSSFTTGNVGDDFSQEMLAWYNDKEPDNSSSTLV